jgi:hypothetical protein
VNEVRLSERIGCCTPVVHQAVSGVVKDSTPVDDHFVSALPVVPTDVVPIFSTERLGHGFEPDTGAIPDLVIVLHRLVI